MMCAVASSAADEPERTDSKVKLGGPAIDAVLREACELALRQDEEQHFWTQRALLDIGELQIQAGDFEGALKSIRGSTYPYGRDLGLGQLAKALGRAGNRERAFEILRLQDSFESFEDCVPLCWIEHVI